MTGWVMAPLSPRNCRVHTVYLAVVFRDVVLLRIEKVIQDVVRSLSCHSSPTIVVANTCTWKNVR